MTEHEIREKIRVLQEKIDRINGATEIKKVLGYKIAEWEEEKRECEHALAFGECVDDLKRVNEEAGNYLQSVDERMAALDAQCADNERKFRKNIVAACDKLAK